MRKNPHRPLASNIISVNPFLCTEHLYTQQSQDRRQLRRNGLGLFVFFFLSGLFLVFYYLCRPERGLIILQVGILCFIFAAFVAIKQFEIDLLSPAFLMLFYFLCAYSLAPLYLVFGKGFSISQPDDEKVMWFAIIFISLVLMGYFSGIGLRVARRLPVPPSDWKPRSVRIILAVGVCLGLLGWLFILVTVGMSPLSQFLNVFEFRYRVFEIGGLYFFRNIVVWSLWIAFWVPFLNYFLKQDARWKTSTVIYLTIAFLTLTVFTNGFGQRFMVIAPIASLLFIANLSWRKLGFLPLVVAVVGFVWFARFYENYRGLGWNRSDFLNLLSESASFDRKSHVFLGHPVQQGEGLLDLLVFSAARVTNLVDYTCEVVCYYPPPGCDFFYGRSYLYVLAGVVPRSIVGSLRAPFTDTFLTRTSYMNPYMATGGTTDYGVAFGQISELYINFRDFGLLGGIVWGIFLRIVEAYAELHRKNPAVLLFYTSGFVNLLTYCILLTTTSVNSINTVDLEFFLLLNTLLSVVLAKHL